MRLGFLALGMLGSGLAILAACSDDDCSATATCAGDTANPVDGSTAIDGSSSIDGATSDGAIVVPPLTVLLTAPPTTAYVIQGTKTEVTIGIQRGAGVGAFSIGASALPAGLGVDTVTVSADATSAKIAVDVPLTQAQGPLDGLKLSAFVDDAGPSHGDLALPVFVRGPSGSLDTTFGEGSGSYTEGEFVAAVAQPDGKIATIHQILSPASVGVVRFQPDGGLDPSFGDGGLAKVPGSLGKHLVLGSDGRIFVLLDDSVTALRSTGVLDTSFGGGVVSESNHTYDLALGPAGSVFVTKIEQTLPNPAVGVDIQRLTSVGAPDSTFGSGGVRLVRDHLHGSPSWTFGGALSSAADGTTYVAYAARDDGGLPLGAVTAVAPTSLVGTSAGFGCSVTNGGGVGRIVQTLGADGKVVVIASPSTTAESGPVCVHRFTGALDTDTTFAGTGGVTAFTTHPKTIPTSVQELADGTVFIAGIAQSTSGQDDEVVLQRFHADGTLDSSYGVSGLLEVSAKGALDIDAPQLTGAYIQPDGSVIAVGSSANGNPSGPRIFRLWP